MIRSAARILAIVTVLCPAIASAQGTQTPPQPPPPVSLTLEQALQYAVDHYPTVRAALEQVNASTAGVSVAKSAYWPRLDSLWQSNRGTANNIFGQVLPQSVIPAMSGPVLTSASGGSVWGSATGALFSWEPFDFGLRHASVASAEAAVARARAGEELTRLDVQTAVGTAFLNIVGAQRAVAALQADVDRRDLLARAVHTLVDNQLRPGAEASRTDAERAAAQTRLIQAQQAVTLAQITLARVLGVRLALSPSTRRRSSIGFRPMRPPPLRRRIRSRRFARRPSTSRAHKKTFCRERICRVCIFSRVCSRVAAGRTRMASLMEGLSGLGLDRANWAAGVQVVFPNAFDFTSLRARKAAAAASARAETALYDEAMLTVTSQQQAAAAMVQATRAVAANTPVQLAAARQSEAQATARYQAGLASIVEVADAQSLLAQAEVQDQLARIDVWRALLAQAAAQGTLTPFLALVNPSAGAR